MDTEGRPNRLLGTIFQYTNFLINCCLSSKNNKLDESYSPERAQFNENSYHEAKYINILQRHLWGSKLHLFLLNNCKVIIFVLIQKQSYDRFRAYPGNTECKAGIHPGWNSSTPLIFTPRAS